MRNRILVKSAIAVSLFLLSGCEVAHSMRDDLARLTSAPPAPQKPAARPPAPRRTTPVPAAVAATPYDMPPAPPPADAAAAEAPTKPAAASAPPVSLAGKSESELRALLGSPSSEEDRPPGKRWHYRSGQCTLDVQLYPDVQTKQFGTLAYEVKSNDNTDEGKRLCMAQLQSRAHGGN